jgi:hypothetical protein
MSNPFPTQHHAISEQSMTHNRICINFPVTNLARAIHFYEQLGFENHPVFRGPDCQCMIISDHIHIMLHLADSLKQFTPNEVANPGRFTGVVMSLDCESRAEVIGLVEKAVANGGAVYDTPQDLGFIYTHGFTDPDGNVWRVNHFNPDVPIPQ